MSTEEFDQEYYCSKYRDVAISGLEPLMHFLKIGSKIGRAECLKKDKDREKNNYDVLFIDGTEGTSSTQYRVTRIAEGLRNRGFNVKSIKGKQIGEIAKKAIKINVLVVFRAPYWGCYIEFINKYRNQGSLIVYDIDDLVFDVNMLPYIDGYNYLKEEEKKGYINGMNAYREFIMNSDMCTTTTEFLANKIRALGKDCYIVPNSLEPAIVNNFSIRKIRDRIGKFTIGYYSGTKTHQKDFAVVAPALVKFMNDYRDIHFRAVGEIDLSPWPELCKWQLWGENGEMPRITNVSLMPHETMIKDQLTCDVIIAPLEYDNPFCEAKSELKFFEASLVGVPFIGVKNLTFREATLDGKYGHLANNETEWRDAFEDVYLNYSNALLRARRASNYVRQKYSMDAVTEKAVDSYNDFIKKKNKLGGLLKSENKNKYIGVILPDFSGPSGGHRKIFTLCQALEEQGHKLKLYFHSSRNPDIIKNEIDSVFCNLNAEIVQYHGHVDEHSHVICTQWRTAYDFRKVVYKGTIIYFIQDFEPLFYPVGSEYIRAMSGYNLNYQMVCYGNWVAAVIADEFGITPKVIPFTLNHEMFRPPECEKKRDIDILVFARPSQHRRAFELICEGLEILKAKRPNLKIALFGESEYSNVQFEFTNLGVFYDLKELANIYYRTKVGVCFSTTNPSQLGYEMIACGINLVDVIMKHWDLNFDGDEFVNYTSGIPEDFSNVCTNLLDNENEQLTRQNKGYEFIRKMPDDRALGPMFVKAVALN
jgi:glycosyltransferase involved in cell wall biosynthesis